MYSKKTPTIKYRLYIIIYIELIMVFTYSHINILMYSYIEILKYRTVFTDSAETCWL